MDARLDPASQDPPPRWNSPISRELFGPKRWKDQKLFGFITGGMSVLMVVVGAAGLFVAIRRLKD